MAGRTPCVLDHYMPTDYTALYRCIVHSDIHTVCSPTDAHLLKL